MDGGVSVSALEEGGASIVGQDLAALPAAVVRQYAHLHKLDVSYNAFRSLALVDGFPQLESLVADSNEVHEAGLGDVVRPQLTTLSVNGNHIADLAAFLADVGRAFPALTFLSMLKNPCCPNFFTGKDQEDYRRYRLYVISVLPGLRFLDSTRVTDEERAEAERVGRFQIVAKPTSQQDSAPTSFTGADQGNENDDDDDDDEDEGEGLTPVGADAPGRGKVSFGVSRYVYYGKQSEGNRFILNQDL